MQTVTNYLKNNYKIHFLSKGFKHFHDKDFCLNFRNMTSFFHQSHRECIHYKYTFYTLALCQCFCYRLTDGSCVDQTELNPTPELQCALTKDGTLDNMSECRSGFWHNLTCLDKFMFVRTFLIYCPENFYVLFQAQQ